MTYNVHSCIGSDGRFSTFRIADVIAQYEPDIVALQELDAGRIRTGEVHQARRIAAHLKMDFHFHPSLRIREEQYGNAIMSRHPIRLVQAGALPTFTRRLLEKRGALWTAIRFGNREVQIINTHLGLQRQEKVLQAETLLGVEWAAHSLCRPPLVVCGDFNAIPLSPAYRRFRRVFRDAQLSVGGYRPRNTWPSRFPFFRIDHVFTNHEVAVRNVEVPRDRMTRAASDHLPLIVDVNFS